MRSRCAATAGAATGAAASGGAGGRGGRVRGAALPSRQPLSRENPHNPSSARLLIDRWLSPASLVSHHTPSGRARAPGGPPPRGPRAGGLCLPPRRVLSCGCDRPAARGSGSAVRAAPTARGGRVPPPPPHPALPAPPQTRLRGARAPRHPVSCARWNRHPPFSCTDWRGPRAPVARGARRTAARPQPRPRPKGLRPPDAVPQPHALFRSFRAGPGRFQSCGGGRPCPAIHGLPRPAAARRHHTDAPQRSGSPRPTLRHLALRPAGQQPTPSPESQGPGARAALTNTTRGPPRARARAPFNPGPGRAAPPRRAAPNAHPPAPHIRTLSAPTRSHVRPLPGAYCLEAPAWVLAGLDTLLRQKGAARQTGGGGGGAAAAAAASRAAPPQPAQRHR
jgi:hypothetical protein